MCPQATYVASFPEDIPINYGILTVTATDFDIGTNAEIQYSLFGIGVEDFFMDTNTGKEDTHAKRIPILLQSANKKCVVCRSLDSKH